MRVRMRRMRKRNDAEDKAEEAGERQHTENMIALPDGEGDEDGDEDVDGVVHADGEDGEDAEHDEEVDEVNHAAIGTIAGEVAMPDERADHELRSELRRTSWRERLRMRVSRKDMRKRVPGQCGQRR